MNDKYPPAQTWTIGALLRERALSDGERPFVEPFGGRAHTYAEVWESVQQTARGLAAVGVRPGDNVVLMLRNGLDALLTWFGANLLGAVDVSLNTALRGPTFEHAMNLVQARHLVIGAEFLPMLRASEQALPHLETVLVIGADVSALAPVRWPLLDFYQVQGDAPEVSWPEVAPQDTACIIYTSGTTGPAKGVRMPHAQVMLVAHQTVRHTRVTRDDIYYSFHPLYHMAGKFMQVLACAVAGAKLVLDDSFVPAQWLQRVRDSRATLGGGHGPMLEMIYAQPPSPQDRQHRLRTLCSAPFPRHIALEFEERFGVRGVEVWGMTEVGIPLWSSLEQPLRAGSCGKVDTDWFEFAVVDPVTDAMLPPGEVGEFVVRSKQPWTLMQGYVGMPEKTVEAWRNLWFHTGDLGYLDAEGNVYFADRVAERIRRRAENVSAYDIEVAAQAYPAVAEAAAIGTPSEFAGDDDIRLCVVLKVGAQLDPEALLRHLAERLPHHMVPRYIEPIENLPRSATHKVQRAQLRREPLGPQAWDRKAHGVVLRELTK